jgi:hypothetical protein
VNKERYLLPWILGALLVAGAALAITAVSTKSSATWSRQTPAVAAAQDPSLPVSREATPAPPPSPDPMRVPMASDPAATPASGVPAPTMPAAPEPAALSGQIWECTTRGVKTFSNNPCGEKSTLLEVGPINTMHPPPAPHYARAYSPAPQYATAYADPAASYDQNDYSDQVGSETGGDTYTIVQGGAFVPRRHTLHPPHHPSYRHGPPGPMPKKY